MSKSFLFLAFVLMAATLLGIVSQYTSPALACWGGFISVLAFAGCVDEYFGKSMKPIILVSFDTSAPPRLPSIARLRSAFVMIVVFFIAGFYGFFQARESLASTLGISETLKNIFIATWIIELCCIIGYCYRSMCNRIFSVRITKGILNRMKPLDQL